jgi:hypothetical protein
MRIKIFEYEKAIMFNVSMSRVSKHASKTRKRTPITREQNSRRTQKNNISMFDDASERKRMMQQALNVSRPKISFDVTISTIQAKFYNFCSKSSRSERTSSSSVSLLSNNKKQEGTRHHINRHTRYSYSHSTQ